MALTKIVNGKPVELTAEQEAAVRADWAANAAATAERRRLAAEEAKKPTLEQQVAALAEQVAALQAKA